MPVREMLTPRILRSPSCLHSSAHCACAICFFFLIGSVIGSGIFLSPGQILKLVNGSVGLSMLVWVAGGVMSLLGALTYAELAAANPEDGGLYCYIRDGFGRLPAFLYGCCCSW